MTEVNARVGAVQKADDTEVYFYGWGKYIGDEVPDRGFLSEMDIKNPCIALDNGKKVYGFECWWGEAEKVKEMIGERNIIEVEIPSGG
jgi:hypothetical protein